MIVRNESAVIGRCIESVAGLIDSWVVVDTGSIDQTPDLVRSALADLPGELHQRCWRDFGSNRSELMTLARGTADYLLLLDADMTLVRRSAMPELSADAYMVAHEGPLAYSVPRVVRGDIPWRYVGATHEYLTTDRPFEMASLDALAVCHHEDGGSRADKLERDRHLLEKQLSASPDDPRTVFYLAQTCRDLGAVREAAALYERRVALGGWDEEVFYAALQHGVLVADLDWTVGLELLLQAWELRPFRVEPLYEIAWRARHRGDDALAEWATLLGVDAVLPPDVLFVHRWVYEWGIRLERSIACARLGKLEEARAITDELLEESLPEHVTTSLVSNRAWLEQRCSDTSAPRRHAVAGRASHIAELAELCGGSLLEMSVADTTSDWRETNPSIANDGSGFRAIVRKVNYELHDGRYVIRAPDGAIRTSNVVVTLDEGLNWVSTTRLAEPKGLLRHPTGVEGFEDCRLFRWRDRWWAVATSRELTADGRCCQVLLSLDGGALELARALPGPDPTRHEKNWMPVVVGDELFFVYSCRPFTVLRYDAALGRLEAVARVPTDYRFVGLRGGSQGLPVDDGYLFVAHQVVPAGWSRVYAHRFVSVDASLSPTGISPPFVFVHAGIEFCAGIAASGQDVVLSFGIEDGRAALARVPLDAVIDAIEPLGGWPAR